MHGLYLMWWVQEKHVPAAAVAAILAAGDLALAVFEVPTGWIADRRGHRVSLIVGSLVQMAGMLCCWLGQGIPGLLAASVLVALGDAFRSGADQALLYRSCAALDREPEFQKIEARARALQTLALVGLILAGGAIVQAWGFAAGWAAETILAAIGLLIASAMIEPPRTPGQTDDEQPRPSGSPAITASRAEMRSLLWLIVPASLLAAAESAASFVAQTGGGIDPLGMTRFVAAIALAEAAGSVLAARLGAAGRRTQIVVASVAGIVIVIAAAQAQPAALRPATVALSFLLGLSQPLRAAAIQRAASEQTRARAASLASACDKMLTTLALLGAGIGSRPDSLVRHARRRV